MTNTKPKPTCDYCDKVVEFKFRRIDTGEARDVCPKHAIPFRNNSAWRMR